MRSGLPSPPNGICDRLRTRGARESDTATPLNLFCFRHHLQFRIEKARAFNIGCKRNNVRAGAQSLGAMQSWHHATDTGNFVLFLASRGCVSFCFVTRRSSEDAALQSPTRPPSKDSYLGGVIDGKYRILSLLATGAMGRVYRAEQIALERVVALKLLFETPQGWDPTAVRVHRVSGGSGGAERFLREASVCARLTHPHTVTVLDYGVTSQGVYYVAMELLEGRTLRQVLSDEGPLRCEQALKIALQVTRSLREGHRQGVIHRDLKPGNIFLVEHEGEEDFVKVLDFGLAKATATSCGEVSNSPGRFVGSPAYIAPEQVQDSNVDGRTDVYALGVVLYEMLTGRVPFRDSTAIATLMAHLEKTAPPMALANPSIRVSTRLERVVRKCLAKQPLSRFASIEDVQRALIECVPSPVSSLSSVSSTWPRRSRPEPGRFAARWLSPRRYLTWLVIVALVAIVPASYHWQSSKRRAQPAMVSIRSTPAGAQVFAGTELVCIATPCRVSWPDDAFYASGVELVLRYPEGETGFSEGDAKLDNEPASKNRGRRVRDRATRRRSAKRRSKGAAEGSPPPSEMPQVVDP